MNRALFLDRDGVINEDYGYVHKVEDFHFREGIFDVCHAAQKARMKIIVVTNQAGIGRGLYTLADLKKVTNYMLANFMKESISISGVYHCPYHPTHGIGHYNKESSDRKPQAGMLVRAARDLEINLAHSIMVGDKLSDKQAAGNSGIRYYFDASLADWQDNVIKALGQ